MATIGVTTFATTGVTTRSTVRVTSWVGSTGVVAAGGPAPPAAGGCGVVAGLLAPGVATGCGSGVVAAGVTDGVEPGLAAGVAIVEVGPEIGVLRFETGGPGCPARCFAVTPAARWPRTTSGAATTRRLVGAEAGVDAVREARTDRSRARALTGEAWAGDPAVDSCAMKIPPPPIASAAATAHDPARTTSRGAPLPRRMASPIRASMAESGANGSVPRSREPAPWNAASVLRHDSQSARCASIPGELFAACPSR